jgi:tetratricopeptide (TPR) repeat protein
VQARRLWKEAHQAFVERDYERCAARLRTMLDDCGEGAGGVDGAAARLQLGVTLLRLKQTREGVAELQRSVELDPGVGRAHHKLGIGLARLRRNDEALEHFRQAVALAPDTPDHQWRLGEELRRKGRKREALGAIRRCLELQPDHAEALATKKALGYVDGPLSRLVARLGIR